MAFLHYGNIRYKSIHDILIELLNLKGFDIPESDYTSILKRHRVDQGGCLSIVLGLT